MSIPHKLDERADVKQFTNRNNKDAGGRLEHKASSAPKTSITQANVLTRQHNGKRARTEDTPEEAGYAHVGPKRVRHWKPTEDVEVTPLKFQPVESQSPHIVQDTPNVKNAPKIQVSPKVKKISRSHDVQVKEVENEHETRVRTRKRTRSQSFVDSDEALLPIDKRARIDSAVLVTSLMENTPVSNSIHLIPSLDDSALSHCNVTHLLIHPTVCGSGGVAARYFCHDKGP